MPWRRPLPNESTGRSVTHDWGIIVDEFGRYHTFCKSCGFGQNSAYLTCPGRTISTRPASEFAFQKR